MLKGVVGTELNDLRNLCAQLGDVLEVLVRRANDLSVQQQQCLDSLVE